VPYDVEGMQLGHVDGRCSFDSILLKYGLDDLALRRLGAIVHGADVEADLRKSPSQPVSRRSLSAFASFTATATTRNLRPRC